MDRYSEYRVMWILVFFDLPTETQKDKKAYALFRKNLQKDGFTMFNSQSIFVIVQVMKMQKFISKELNLFYQSSVR